MLEVAAITKTFFLVFGAEIGDKSQLVCMALAARYRPAPIVLGAVAAFIVLNLLAVTVGAAASLWLPEWLILAVVAVLFAVFGLLALRSADEDEDEVEPLGKYLFWSVFGLIFMAELGDKTQLAIAGLSGVESVASVWLGGTLALALTTVLGVWLGRVLLQRIPIALVHRAAGVLFILFALWMVWRLLLVLNLL